MPITEEYGCIVFFKNQPKGLDINLIKPISINKDSIMPKAFKQEKYADSELFVENSYILKLQGSNIFIKLKLIDSGHHLLYINNGVISLQYVHQLQNCIYLFTDTE